MPAVPTTKLAAPKPAGSTAVADVDKASLIRARASLLFFGDDTTFAPAAGKVPVWNSQAETTTYSQATDTQQPDYSPNGGPLGLPYALFSGTADANGDRMAWSDAAQAVGQGQTVVDLIRVDVATKTFLDGQESGTDNLAGFAIQGTVKQRYGDATASVPISQGQWAVVTRSWVIANGVAQCEIHCDGVRNAATATVVPTTARLLHLGATSNIVNSIALFKGGWAARLRFAEYIGTDRAFFRDVVGAYMMERYQRGSVNPIAAVS